ncbi:MAG TPA: hypothetical protein PK743_04480 [Luteimonas sp.]|nr:hypothetical protein [Luteimonas sp.]
MKSHAVMIALACLCLPGAGCADGGGAIATQAMASAAGGVEGTYAEFLPGCRQRLTGGEHAVAASEAERQCAAEWKGIETARSLAETVTKAATFAEPDGVDAATLRQALTAVSWRSGDQRGEWRGTLGDLGVSLSAGRVQELSFYMDWGFEDDGDISPPNVIVALRERGHVLEPLLCGWLGGTYESVYKVTGIDAGSQPFMLVIEKDNPMTANQGFSYSVRVALDGRNPSPEQLHEDWYSNFGKSADLDCD